MRSLILFITLCFAFGCLSAFEIPFSRDAVHTEENTSGEFLRIDPLDFQPEVLKTKAWFWQDDKALYVKFESVIDETFHIGQNRGRDGFYQSDFVRIQLVTIPEAYYAYMYVAQPNGALYDGVRSYTSGVDTAWNSSYSYETAHNDSLWQVLMKIPLGELRYHQKLPYNWKIILTRYNDQSETYYSFPPRDTNEGKGYYTQAQEIVLNHKVPRLLDLQLKPYFVKSYDLVNKTNSFDPENVGLDIAFNPGSRTKIKISLNPDYSDAPLDGAMDIYNTRYPPYFNENRFFFTEDLDAFGVDSNVFYSRNIVKPQLAYKLTGNVKSMNYGILGAWDKEQRSGDYVITSDDYYQVLSIIPSTRNLTFCNALVSKMNRDYYNHVYSGDLRLKLYKDFYLNADHKASTRFCKDEEKNTKNGYNSSVEFEYDAKNWNLSVDANKVSEDFLADMGYYTDTNCTRWGTNVTWDSDTKDKFLKNWGISYWNGFFRIDNQEKNSETSHCANIYFALKPKFNFSVYASISRVLDLKNSNHVVHELTFNTGFWAWEKFKIYSSLTHSKAIVYSHDDTRDRNNISLTLDGTLFEKLSYSVNVMHTEYKCPKHNLEMSSFEPREVYLDNQYQIINANIYFNPDSSIHISNGLGISTYEEDSIYQNLSNYGSLGYEFKRDCFLYIGYQTKQLQDEKAKMSNLLGHYIRSSASAYLKVAITI
ncbi:MAG: hypothetical protein PHI68_01095 [Candidatus Cloacimonetes bacterium]|nr:hypothetical protein [Candidatus Cloacimonadota bacterium]